MASGGALKLRSFDSDGAPLSYSYDPSSGDFQATTHSSSDEASDGARGVADVRCIGVRQREDVFVAVYSWQDRLHLAVYPQAFSWPGPFRAKRGFTRLGGPVKSFSVERGKRKYLQFYYLFRDSEWPPTFERDIFVYIATKAGSQNKLYRFIYFWEAHASGRGCRGPEFEAGFERYLSGKAHQA